VLIVSFDGGGARGILSAAFVRELELRTGARLADRADLLCGSSTGAILACGLAAGRTGEEAVDLYLELCRRVFAGRWRAWLRRAFRARYDHEPLERELRAVFGELRLGDLATRVLITAYDRRRRRALILKSWKPAHARVTVWEACRASAAAQTYFAPHAMRLERRAYILVDGGTVANHPGLCGLAEAVRLGQALDQIRLVACGTGQPGGVVGDDGGLTWGILESAPHLAGELLDGPAEAVDYQARQVLGDRYARLQVTLPEALLPMDRGDPEHLRRLVAWGTRALAQHRVPDLERATALLAAPA